MSKPLTLQRLLLRNTLPGQIGILGVLLLFLMVVFYLYATIQLEDKHQAYSQQVITSLSDGVEATTTQMQALANNDFIVNSLIDLQQRNDYLPLFFQSLRVSNASSASIGFFDFDGELIAGRNWLSVTLNESSGQWRSLVLSQGQNFRAVDADGVFIVVPVLLGELAEGALAMKADSLETFIRVEQNDAIQIIVNQQGMVLYSSRPDVMPISTVVSEHLMQDYVAEQREYGDLTVISYEEFGTAYASLLILLPVLLLAMLAVAAVSSLSARLAAKYAAGTLTDFQLSLENEVHTSKAPQVDREAEDAKELQDIKRSFYALEE